MNPSTQHAEQAKKILARRASGNSNETGTPTKTEPTKAPAVNVPTPVTGADKYAGMNIKALRAECKRLEISYTKKDKADALIAKLEA